MYPCEEVYDSNFELIANATMYRSSNNNYMVIIDKQTITCTYSESDNITHEETTYVPVDILVQYGESTTGAMANVQLPLTYSNYYIVVHVAKSTASQTANNWQIRHFCCGKTDLSHIWCGHDGGWITLGY